MDHGYWVSLSIALKESLKSMPCRCELSLIWRAYIMDPDEKQDDCISLLLC